MPDISSDLPDLEFDENDFDLPTPRRKSKNKPSTKHEVVKPSDPLPVPKANFDTPEGPDRFTSNDILRKYVDDNKTLLAALDYKQQELRSKYPSSYFIPNRGQWRFYERYKQPVQDESYESPLVDYLDMPFPYIHVFGAGNGVGKTASLGVFLCGLLWGSQFLSSKFKPLFPFFDGYREWVKRRNRPSYIWIVCPGVAMQRGGAMYQSIMDWFPRVDGLWSMDKSGHSFYSTILTKNGGMVSVKTPNQSALSKTGVNVDWVLYDEPPDRDTYAEAVARTRNGGNHAFFMTPLLLASWMVEQILDDLDDKDRVLTEASIWDNCRDIPGTNGHLSKKHIDKLIREWQKISPDEVEARVYGKFNRATGAIYKQYDQAVHEMDEFPIPKDWPIFMCIDPHDTRQPFVIWVAQGPNNHSYIIREYPTEPYAKQGMHSGTIEDMVRVYLEFEASFSKQIAGRYMDPRKGKFTYMNTKRTVQQEWTQAGMHCQLVKGADDLAIVHRRVNGLLHYDKGRPFHHEHNSPKIRVFKDRCPNVSLSFRGYGFKEGKDPSIVSLTNAIDQTYKDPMDCVGFYAMMERPFERVNNGADFSERIYRGRIKQQKGWNVI